MGKPIKPSKNHVYCYACKRRNLEYVVLLVKYLQKTTLL